MTTTRADDLAKDGQGKANEAAAVAMPPTTCLRVAISRRRESMNTTIRKFKQRPLEPDDFWLNRCSSRTSNLSPVGRGRIAIAIRVRGRCSLRETATPHPNPLPKGEGAHHRRDS